jgi:transcriptional regulator with XRE-family HTH domain
MSKSDIKWEDIEKFMKDRNLSQEDLAKLLNVSANTVARWKKGDSKITGTAAAILGALTAGAIPLIGFGAALGFGAAYGIYQLLKEKFEPDRKEEEDPK